MDIDRGRRCYRDSATGDGEGAVPEVAVPVSEAGLDGIDCSLRVDATTVGRQIRRSAKVMMALALR